MKTTLNLFLITLLTLFTISQGVFAQDSPQWHLPDGVIARYGKGKIHQIKYSPDGNIMAVASGIGVWIYDAATGEELDLYTGHSAWVNSIDINYDNTLLVSGSRDSTIRLWDLQTGATIRTITAHTDAVTTVAFSPDGSMFASGSWDDTVRIWETTTGNELHNFTRHERSISSVAFNHDGKRLVSADTIGRIYLWSTQTGDYLRSYSGHRSGVYSIAFNHDGSKLVSGGWDKSVRIWDVAFGSELHTLNGHTHHIETVLFSKNGAHILSGGRDNTIRLWYTNSGKEYLIPVVHTNNWVNNIVLHPDGKSFAAASEDNTVRIWSGLFLDAPKQIRTFATHTNFGDLVMYDQNGQTIAAGVIGNNIHLWEIGTNRRIQTFIGHTDTVNSIAISPGHNLLVSGSDDGTTRIWDVQNGIELNALERSIGGVDSVTFSPDGQKVASVGTFMNSTISIYDAKTGANLKNITAYKLPPLSASPNPTFLSYEHTSSVNQIAFSPRGDVIASCSGDGTVRLWNINTGRHEKVFTGHTDDVYRVAFSPDGSMIASSSWDDTVRLWDVDSGVEIRQFIGHEGNVQRVVFSPDGREIASGSWDYTIRFWNVDTGEQLRTLNGHTGSIQNLAYSPDGNTLASISYDGTLLLWDITPTMSSGTTIALAPATVESPEIDELLTLSLNVTEGQQVAGYQATVHFDNTALRYVGSANGDFLPTSSFFIPPKVETNTITLASTAFSGGESNGDGTLATITFEIVVVKNSTVSLSNVLLADNTGGKVVPQLVSAEILEPQADAEDVNEDGVVDVDDLVLVASNFGKRGDNPADVNGDGVVDIVDLIQVAAVIGDPNEMDPAAPIFWSANPDELPSRQTVLTWLNKAQQLNLNNPEVQRGILFLENLLKTITPKQTAVLPNYPNPFNPETWIPYQLSVPADVSISIFTANGRLVRTLDIGFQPVGNYHHRTQAAYWDGKNAYSEPVASGVYFFTFTAGKFSETRKMLIRK